MTRFRKNHHDQLPTRYRRIVNDDKRVRAGFSLLDDVSDQRRKLIEFMHKKINDGELTQPKMDEIIATAASSKDIKYSVATGNEIIKRELLAINPAWGGEFKNFGESPKGLC